MKTTTRRPLSVPMIVAIIVAVLAFPAVAHAASQNVYRFYNARTGTHFYTASDAERASVITRWPGAFSYEGVAYSLETASPTATRPLYRFFNVRTGTHFYTASEAEKSQVIATLSDTFQYEAVAYMVSSSPTEGATPVYRFYNHRKGGHFYTSSAEERDAVMSRFGDSYSYEGIGFWIPLASAAAPVPVVTSGQQAEADAVLEGLKLLYPRFLDGVTVTIGQTPNNYQAVCYYSTGRIVVNPNHVASMSALMNHEIWHVIDWRDNGRIDWRESVPPANAADFRG
jgi:hypothetical protein